MNANSEVSLFKPCSHKTPVQRGPAGRFTSSTSSQCRGEIEHREKRHGSPSKQISGQHRQQPELEWVIKRRPDGTRYVTRRPVRKRAMPSLLAAVKARREQSLARERAGMSTTDDDGGSEVTGTGFSTFMDAENERFKQLRLKKKHAEWWEWLIESHERNLKSEARDRALLEENKRLKSDGFFKDALIAGLKFDLDEAKKAAEKQLTEAKIDAEKQLDMAKKDAEKQLDMAKKDAEKQMNEKGQQLKQLWEEIRRLKEELKDSAKEIQQLKGELAEQKQSAAAEIQRVNDALEEQTQKVEGMQRSAMMAQSAFKMPSRRKGCALIGASTSSSSFRSSPSTAGHISPVHSVAAVDSSFGKHKVTGVFVGRLVVDEWLELGERRHEDNQIMRQGNKIAELGQQLKQLWEEIRRLKEELKDSAKEIQQLKGELAEQKQSAAAEIQRVNDALEEQTQKVEGMQRSAMMAQSAFKMPSRRKGCALIGASTSSSSFRSSPSTAGHISPVHSVAAVDSSFGKHKVTGGVSSSVDPMSLFAQLQPFIDDKSSSSNSGQIKPGSDVLSDCHSSAGPRSLQEVGAVVGAMVDVVVGEDARSLQEVGAVLGAMVDVVVEEDARSLQEEDARSLQEVDAVVGAGADVVEEGCAVSVAEPLKLVEPQNNMGEVEQQGDVEELPLAAPHQQRNIISSVLRQFFGGLMIVLLLFLVLLPSVQHGVLTFCLPIGPNNPYEFPHEQRLLCCSHRECVMWISNRALQANWNF
uniref:Myosin_tail_1 domain-containing protein n=1 Tax=Globodera pallida TaxID=36090 RepID=A0A183BJQ2_GLOPA